MKKPVPVLAAVGLTVFAAVAWAGAPSAPPPHPHVYVAPPTPAFGPDAKERPSPTSDPSLEALAAYCFRNEGFQGKVRKILHAWLLPVATARWLVPSFRDDVGGELKVAVALAEGDFMATSGPNGHPRNWAYLVLLPKQPKIIHVKMSQVHPTPGIPFTGPPEEHRF